MPPPNDKMLTRIQDARLFSLLWSNLVQKSVTFPDTPHPLCQGIDHQIPSLYMVLEDKLQKTQTRHFHHCLILIGEALPDSGEDCGARIPQWSYNSTSNSCQVSFIIIIILIIIIIKLTYFSSSPIGTADAVPRPISSAMSSCAESDAAHHPMVGVKP